MLDSVRTVETPEGVELQLSLAGPVVRALAWALDFLIRAAIYLVLIIALPSSMGRFGVGVLFILFFLLEWFYPVLYEVYRHGMTPGKRAMGIKVLKDSGAPMDWGSSTLRNLIRFADFLPLFYCFGMVSMLLNRDFKRLGDLAAGTVVVYDSGRAAERGLPEAEPLVPPMRFSMDEQQALLDYAERADQLSDERQLELARVLSPVTGSGDKEGVRRLHQMANWIYGRR